MDFYAYQATARRRTRWLLLGFILAVAIVVTALDAVIFTLLAASQSGGARPLDYILAHPGPALFYSLIFVAVIALASMYRSFELRGGGAVVARSLGGVRVESDTQDLKLKRLRNIVEEMAIASGVPVPEIYVLEHEAGINAFAAGHTPANAAVTVTQGALDHLDRDELQGVIGHEFSHVLNGDMRLNVQLIGWLFGLLVITLIGRTILQFTPRGRDRRNGAAAILALALAMIVLGYIGLIAGRILQAAVSRQRERLADASSVQFTRNPQGLKGALVKIAALEEGSYLTALHTEQVAHMLFAPGLDRIFATHPPLLERIRKLDPQFDPKEIERLTAAGVPDSSVSPEEATAAAPAGAGATAVRPTTAGPTAAGPTVLRPGGLRPGTAGLVAGSAGSMGAGRSAGGWRAVAAAADPGALGAAAPGAAAAVSAVPAAARSIAAQVGQVESIHIAHAQELRLRLPDALRQFTDGPAQARALVLAMLLARDDAVRATQLRALAGSLSPVELAAVEGASRLARELDPMLRLPALLQLFPALRRLALADRQSLQQLTTELIQADNRVEVFEYCLARLLAMLLEDQMQASAPHGSLTLEDAVQPIHVLFATLARVGAADDREARAAYETGMQAVLPMRRPPYVAYTDWPRRLDAALPTLESLQPFAKQALIEGLVRTIASDERLNVEEAELLRTTCALLHCPLPPLLTA